MDWHATVDSVRLVSRRAREVLAAAGPDDVIQWIAATLVAADDTELEYWIRHFPVWPDIFDAQASAWYGRDPSDSPVRWVLSAAKVAGRHVFVVPKHIGAIVLSESAWSAVGAAGLTGMEALRARLV